MLEQRTIVELVQLSTIFTETLFNNICIVRRIIPCRNISNTCTLKTLCRYCDPCDSFKYIPILAKGIPNSKNALQSLFRETQNINPYPHSVEIGLIMNIEQFKDLKKKERRSNQAVLEHTQMFSIEYAINGLNTFADIHLTSLL